MSGTLLGGALVSGAESDAWLAYPQRHVQEALPEKFGRF